MGAFVGSWPGATGVVAGGRGGPPARRRARLAGSGRRRRGRAPRPSRRCRAVPIRGSPCWSATPSGRCADGAGDTPGTAQALWVVTGGYLLRDYNVGRRRLVRVVFVGETGKRRLVARSRQWVDVAVSPGGGRVAI